MKILNLFCGIGGNRTLWGNEHEITAVDNNQQVAKIYLKRFPNDTVIVGDAYEYNRDHHNEFDFIWASPPCITHTRMCAFPSFKEDYPDFKLFELIVFLGRFFKGIHVIENVIPHYKLKNIDPFYNPFIIPTAIIDRHYIWTNFPLKNKRWKKPNGNFKDLPLDVLCKWLKVDMDLINLLPSHNKRNHDNKRNVLRNCVLPLAGKYILDSIHAKTLDNWMEFGEEEFPPDDMKGDEEQ